MHPIQTSLMQIRSALVFALRVSAKLGAYVVGFAIAAMIINIRLSTGDMPKVDVLAVLYLAGTYIVLSGFFVPVVFSVTRKLKFRYVRRLAFMVLSHFLCLSWFAFVFTDFPRLFVSEEYWRPVLDFLPVVVVIVFLERAWQSLDKLLHRGSIGNAAITKAR